MPEVYSPELILLWGFMHRCRCFWGDWAIYLEGLNGLLVREALERLSIHLQYLITWKVEKESEKKPKGMQIQIPCGWGTTAFDDNCSKCIRATVSWPGVSIYLLLACHLLQLLHWRKLFWRIYPSSPGLNPAHRQCWSRDPTHSNTHLYEPGFTIVQMVMYLVYTIVFA